MQFCIGTKLYSYWKLLERSSSTLYYASIPMVIFVDVLRRLIIWRRWWCLTHFSCHLLRAVYFVSFYFVLKSICYVTSLFYRILFCVFVSYHLISCIMSLCSFVPIHTYMIYKLWRNKKTKRPWWKLFHLTIFLFDIKWISAIRKVRCVIL